MKTRAALFLALLTTVAHAGPRTSVNYTVATDTADAGGKRTTSASYTNDGSAGAVAGISTVTAPAETEKHGYLAQLFDVTGLTLTAASLDVNEGTADQLAAWQVLDDATFLAVPAESVAWSVVSGPLTGITAGGLASAGIVFQDSAATAQGIFSGHTGMLGLTVKNVNTDDFGSYAGDGLGDDWQFQYFGLDNPLAGPLLDPDGDGQDNDFEFTAGIIPTDPISRFLLRIEPVPDEAGKKNLIFSPIVEGRTYTVEHSDSLTAGPWTTLTGGTEDDEGDERTVTDNAATAPRKFYQVKVQKP